MTDLQNKIYKLILKRELLTVQSVAEVIQIPETEARKHLNELADHRLIKPCWVMDFKKGKHVRAFRSPIFEENESYGKNE